MLIVTNTERFPRTFTTPDGKSGHAIIARTAAAFLEHAHTDDAVFLVDCNPGLAFSLARSLWFNKMPALVSVDLVLRIPQTLGARLMHPWKRALLGRFDHHLHYFRDVSGLERVWGISACKSSYVPFKPNLAYVCDVPMADDGEYILCFGRSLRDFDLFFSAVEKLPYPAAIAEPNVHQLRAHGAKFTRPLNELPPNVRILPDNGSTKAQIQLLRGARLLVLPILKTSLVASGISTCLNAMLMGKCVIGTAGPGMSDIFTEEALIAPADDADALAGVIRRAWEDDSLRQHTANAGHDLAVALGGEQDLYRRIIAQLTNWYAGWRASLT